MRIPKIIKDGGLIVRVDSSCLKIKGRKGQILWGESCTGAGTIRVLSKKVLSPSQQALVFLHELVHRVDSNLDLNLTERKVKLLSFGLFSIIAENKLIFHEVPPRRKK